MSTQQFRVSLAAVMRATGVGMQALANEMVDEVTGETTTRFRLSRLLSGAQDNWRLSELAAVVRVFGISFERMWEGDITLSRLPVPVLGAERSLTRLDVGETLGGQGEVSGATPTSLGGLFAHGDAEFEDEGAEVSPSSGD